jgi:hypothetical protein
MTKTHAQFMSAFALSAAALFLGGCKDKPESVDPESTATPKGPDTDPADASPAAELDPAEQVKCFGINACSGQSACNVNKPDLGIEHACAGENACAGKGWIKVTREECSEKQGEVLA